MRIDRRSFLAASAGALIARPLAAQEAKSDPYFAALHAAAQKEGELAWYIAHWSTEIAEHVAAEFATTWPGVKANVVRATSQVIYQRLSQDMKAGVANCDVFGSADNGHYPPLRAQNKLLAFAPNNLQFCVPVLKDFDPDHFVTITDTNPTILAYNTRLVKKEDAPKKWTDLLDPKWSGQIVVAHPGYSGAMGAWTVAMTKLYGWEFFEKLHANKPLVTRSLVDPPVTIAGGERQVGLSTVGSAASMNARGLPVAPVFPEDGSMLNVGPSSIMASTTHPNAAKLFMEFMLGKEVGAIMASEYNLPVRADVAPGPGLKPLAEMTGIKSDPVELSQKLPDLIEKWRDTFGV
jgi:iron(III) transport system substrate-binding protein